MMISEFGWLIGLHVVISIWLGLVATGWKRRNTWLWVAIGLVTSVAGLVILALLPRQTIDTEADMAMQYLDGTRLQ